MDHLWLSPLSDFARLSCNAGASSKSLCCHRTTPVWGIVLKVKCTPKEDILVLKYIWSVPNLIKTRTLIGPKTELKTPPSLAPSTSCSRWCARSTSCSSQLPPPEKSSCQSSQASPGSAIVVGGKRLERGTMLILLVVWVIMHNFWQKAYHKRDGSWKDRICKRGIVFLSI